MFKRNKLLTVAVSSALITLSAMSTAQETTTSTATVTVQNAFNLAEVTALSFGTLRATQNLDLDGTGGTAPATFTSEAIYAVKSDGTANTITAAVFATNATNGASAFSELIAGEPAEYAISNAAPFTNLTIQEPAAAGSEITLTNPSASANADFAVTIEFADMTISGGGNDGDVVTGSNLLTDATGAVGVLIGGRIEMNPAATDFLDGDYTATYTVTVDY